MNRDTEPGLGYAETQPSDRPSHEIYPPAGSESDLPQPNGNGHAHEYSSSAVLAYRIGEAERLVREMRGDLRGQGSDLGVLGKLQRNGDGIADLEQDTEALRREQVLGFERTTTAIEKLETKLLAAIAKNKLSGLERFAYALGALALVAMALQMFFGPR